MTERELQIWNQAMIDAIREVLDVDVECLADQEEINSALRQMLPLADMVQSLGLAV